MGHKDYMIEGSYSGEGHMHTRCFVEARSVERIIGLPLAERNKLLMSDLSGMTKKDQNKIYASFRVVCHER